MTRTSIRSAASLVDQPWICLLDPTGACTKDCLIATGCRNAGALAGGESIEHECENSSLILKIHMIVNSQQRLTRRPAHYSSSADMIHNMLEQQNSGLTLAAATFCSFQAIPARERPGAPSPQHPQLQKLRTPCPARCSSRMSSPHLHSALELSMMSALGQGACIPRQAGDF